MKTLTDIDLVWITHNMGSLTDIEVEWIIVGFLVVSWVVQMLLVWSQFSSGRKLSKTIRQAKGEWTEAVEVLSSQLDQLQQTQTQSLKKLDHVMGCRPVAEPVAASQPVVRRLNVDKKHQVLGLARRGWDTGDISKKLKLYQGETELMLNLRSYLSQQDAANGK